jgi:hypothetical protein
MINILLPNSNWLILFLLNSTSNITLISYDADKRGLFLDERSTLITWLALPWLMLTKLRLKRLTLTRLRVIFIWVDITLDVVGFYPYWYVLTVVVVHLVLFFIWDAHAPLIPVAHASIHLLPVCRFLSMSLVLDSLLCSLKVLCAKPLARSHTTGGGGEELEHSLDFLSCIFISRQ